MITFTKEQLIASAHARIEFAEMMLAGELEPLKERTWSIELELARIALASLEAEAVALRDERSGSGGISKKPGFNDLPHGTPLYAAPPAPVSVPDERAAFNAWNNDTDCPLAGRDAKTAAWLAWCRRAAMLQGVDGNSPVIPDGCCIMPKKLTAENGGKGALSGEFHVTNRIVCQSCAGEGCEDCNDEGGWDAEIPVSWDTIKRIHEAAVEACSLPAAPQKEAE
ncbi:hypothetical protein [Enterobacter asburiae]|uniref:hypothetical protein n=1 Tax=Enterobacter asburiae TaxID=61645 RepID=UPI00301956D1